jgi:hypothetical protein
MGRRVGRRPARRGALALTIRLTASADVTRLCIGEGRGGPGPSSIWNGCRTVVAPPVSNACRSPSSVMSSVTSASNHAHVEREQPIHVLGEERDVMGAVDEWHCGCSSRRCRRQWQGNTLVHRLLEVRQRPRRPLMRREWQPGVLYAGSDRLLLALAAGNRVVRPRASAMARRVTLGAAVVRPLAAVARSEVRIGESRCRGNRKRRNRQDACQHLAPHRTSLFLRSHALSHAMWTHPSAGSPVYVGP